MIEVTANDLVSWEYYIICFWISGWVLNFVLQHNLKSLIVCGFGGLITYVRQDKHHYHGSTLHACAETKI